MLSDHAYFEPCSSVFESVSETVDEALLSAADAGKKTSQKADEALENAVRKLSDYERKYHPKKIETVAERIEKAEKVDKSSSKALNILMEKFRVREELITLSLCFMTHLCWIFSHWSRNRQLESIFLSISLFQIINLLL